MKSFYFVQKCFVSQPAIPVLQIEWELELRLRVSGAAPKPFQGELLTFEQSL